MKFFLSSGIQRECMWEQRKIREICFLPWDIHKRYCSWFDNSEIDSEFVSWFFPSRRKGFLLKYLCSYVWLLFGIDNIGGNIIWDPTVVSELGWLSGWLFMWIKMEEKGLLWLRWSYSKRKKKTTWLRWNYPKRKLDNWRQLMEFESRWRLLVNCLKFQLWLGKSIRFPSWRMKN